MAELITGLQVEAVRAGLARTRQRIAEAAARAGRDPGDVEVVAATKYVALEEMGTLADAGITVVGENRAQDLQAKVEACGESNRSTRLPRSSSAARTSTAKSSIEASRARQRPVRRGSSSTGSAVWASSVLRESLTESC